MKQNNTPLYIHKDSNHPPSIIKTHLREHKQTIKHILKERTFNQAAHKYHEALRKNGYTYTLIYKPEKRQRNKHETQQTHQKVEHHVLLPTIQQAHHHEYRQEIPTITRQLLPTPKQTAQTPQPQQN